jgi:hypothetical protein
MNALSAAIVIAFVVLVLMVAVSGWLDSRLGERRRRPRFR